MSDYYIGCAVCLNIKAERTPAVVTINGYSTCDEHIDLVSNPGFDIMRLKGKRKAPG